LKAHCRLGYNLGGYYFLRIEGNPLIPVIFGCNSGKNV
jgi:hypothetical protein